MYMIGWPHFWTNVWPIETTFSTIVENVDTIFTSYTGELHTFVNINWSIDENMDFKALLQAEINRKRQKIESKDVMVR